MSAVGPPDRSSDAAVGRPTGNHLSAALGPVAAILFCSAFFQFAQGILNPLVTVQLVDHGTATGLIGVVNAAYFAGFIAGTLHCGRIIDRVGHIRALSVFAVAAADAALLLGLSEPPWPWLLSRAALGYALAGIYVVIESWLNAKATTATRGRIFALYQVVGWGISAVTPLALNLGDTEGPGFIIVAALGFATALVPVALTRVGNPEIVQRSHFGLRHLVAISPLGVAACFASGLVNSAFFGLMPVYTAEHGLTTADLTLVLTGATLGGLAAQWPAGVLSDRLGRRPMMLAGIAVAVAASVIPFLTHVGAVPVMIGLVFLFAAGAGPLYTLGIGQTNDYVMPRDFVAASGGLLGAWAIGASLGTAIAAQVMAAFGADGLFGYEIVVLGALAVFAVHRMIKRPGRPGPPAVETP